MRFIGYVTRQGMLTLTGEDNFYREDNHAVVARHEIEAEDARKAIHTEKYHALKKIALGIQQGRANA